MSKITRRDVDAVREWSDRENACTREIIQKDVSRLQEEVAHLKELNDLHVAQSQRALALAAESIKEKSAAHNDLIAANEKQQALNEVKIEGLKTELASKTQVEAVNARVNDLLETRANNVGWRQGGQPLRDLVMVLVSAAVGAGVLKFFGG